MRLIKEAYEQLLSDDPDTNITLYGLRTIVKSGVIPTIQLGRKTLINYDYLLEYFQHGDKKQGNRTEIIRPIH
jgi:hypothetical protein